MTNHTKTGLLLVIIGLIIGMFSTILFFTISFSIETSNIESIDSMITPATIPAIIGGLILLIGAILIIVGRKDYGEKHSKFVIYALIIFGINIIIGIILSVLNAFFIYNSVSSLSFNAAINLNNFLIIQTVQMIISGTLGGLMYFFLLFYLENKTGKYVLYAALIASITISIIIATYTYLLFEDLFSFISVDSTTSTNIVNNISSLSKVSILGLINTILLVIAVYIPYRRITSGELNPVLQSHLKRCNNCGRVSQKDFVMCPYCGKDFRQQ